MNVEGKQFKPERIYIMKELWYSLEDREFFDSEETARLAYAMWCKANEEPFDEEIFKLCYTPLEESVTIWTKENINEYEPY